MVVQAPSQLWQLLFPACLALFADIRPKRRVALVLLLLTQVVDSLLLLDVGVSLCLKELQRPKALKVLGAYVAIPLPDALAEVPQLVARLALPVAVRLRD